MVYWGIGHQDSSNDCIIHFDSWGSEVHSFRTAKHAGFSQKRASKNQPEWDIYNQQYEKHVSASLLQFAEFF
jgi:hypothetical protein